MERRHAKLALAAQMQPYGIGTEIVDVARVARLVERHGEAFLRRVFTDRELAYCHSQAAGSAECFAAVWAAKIAVLRALGHERPPEFGDWLCLEIDGSKSGPPRLLVGGRCKPWLLELKVADILLTMASCRSHATATALVLR